MKNFEKYKKEVYDAIALTNSDKLLVCAGIKFNPFTDDYREYKGRLYNWLFEEYKAPILDEAEKEYLSAVIKPFRSRVEYIVKWKIYNDFKQFLHIELYGGDCLTFPNFKADTMYRGMEVDKFYTLQELGL